MILCDTEIKAMLASRQIRIEPPPQPEQFGTSSLDLTLGKGIMRWRPHHLQGVTVTVDPSADDF